MDKNKNVELNEEDLNKAAGGLPNSSYHDIYKNTLWKYKNDNNKLYFATDIYLDFGDDFEFEGYSITYDPAAGTVTKVYQNELSVNLTSRFKVPSWCNETDYRII